MALSTIWNALPDGVKEGVKQTPALVLVMGALTAYMSGSWMSSRACQSLRDADQKETIELRAERDQYKEIAFKSVGFVVERAQQSAKVNEKATSDNRPAVATVRVPMKPLTTDEKKSIEKPKDAAPATLEKSLDASRKVLQKADISNAAVTTKKGTP